MAQFFSTIGRHLECGIQTELVVELEVDFGTILSYARKIRNIICVGWHCVKVKGQGELKIEKSRGFPQI